MAVGSFLSEEFAEEYVAKSRVSDLMPFLGGAVMFISFAVAGFIPILPYLIFQGAVAFYSSILFSLVALFGLGVLNGRLSGINPWSRAVRMAILGGLAIAIGVVVGQFFKVS